jgi:hypothetical protein
MIFMIGVGRIVNEEWVFKVFVAEEVSKNAEYCILNQFIDYMQQLDCPFMNYWHAEHYMWNSALKRYPDLSDRKLGEWFDVKSVFMNNHITVRGCFDFKLKNIIKNLHKYGLVNDVQLDTNCKSGDVAYVQSWDVYNQDLDVNSSVIMNDIKKYNEFDCRSLYEIITYMRQDMVKEGVRTRSQKRRLHTLKIN